jgi:hypothetical protein
MVKFVIGLLLLVRAIEGKPGRTKGGAFFLSKLSDNNAFVMYLSRGMGVM